MKRKVEIIAEKSESIQLTKLDLIQKLEMDPVGTLTSYDLDDDTLIELIDYIPVDTFLMCCNPSESLLKKLLEIEYLTDDSLSKLSLTTISKLSPEFLENKIEFINFDRIILNYSTQDDEFFLKNDPDKFIEKVNLHGPYFWRILSSNKLTKETILNNLEKWDWLLLILNNSFSDFTEEEFELIKPYLDSLEDSRNRLEENIDEDNHVFDQSYIEELINNIQKNQ
jgi:hypothetical protein